jgi:DNA-binding NarL/FixJ family response regulator
LVDGSEGSVPSSRVHRAALEALLDALDEPAIVFHERGRVELANVAGQRWLDKAQNDRTLEPLRAALAAGGAHPSFALVRLDERGCPGFVLALSRARPTSLADAVGRASRAWKLSSRESRVLEHLAAGKSNKEIAAALQCAEVTVEKCLTQLFRTSGARSRTELTAKLHAP